MLPFFSPDAAFFPKRSDLYGCSNAALALSNNFLCSNQTWRQRSPAFSLKKKGKVQESSKQPLLV